MANQFNMKVIPPWLIDKMGSCPPAGGGVHAWLFDVSRQLHAHMDPAGIESFLRSATGHVERVVTDREISDAVNNSLPVAWYADRLPYPGSKGLTRPPRPAVDLTDPQPITRWPARNSIERECWIGRTRDTYSIHGLYSMHDRSPVSPDGTCDDWLERLFPGDPFLCLGTNHANTARTMEAARWTFGGADKCGLIVPSPMTAILGKTLDGRTSQRCLGNTGPRRWLVIEFDDGTMDEQAILHWHLREIALLMGWPPLRLAVSSAGKSLHGWYGPDTTEESFLSLMSYAVMLGADRSTWNRCQFVRLPGGLRRTTDPKEHSADSAPEGFEDPGPREVRQPVYYWDPAP